MEFEKEYEKWIRSHLKHSTGPRRERLLEQGHAEKLFLQCVWWPAFQHFRHLHPEYPISDYKDGYRYIDFAYIQPYFRIAVEVDGLGPHWRNITRWQFSDHCQRQNHLIIDGWHILRFSYYDIEERPRLCQQTLHQLMGRLLGDANAEMRSLSVIDREIIRFAMRAAHPIRPTQVSEHLRVSPDSAARHLQKLCKQDWLEPASGSVRVRSYRVHPSRSNMEL